MAGNSGEDERYCTNNGDVEIAQTADAQVLVHRFVTGELALGNLQHREEVLTALQDLPQCIVATDVEVLGFIADSTLAGSGIGYIDAHLLAAVRLAPGSQLWTRDKRLLAVGLRMGLAYAATH